ncbi:hypothetical protein ACVIJ6_004820 [Bradyrhizobium sp. USDA 4369]
MSRKAATPKENDRNGDRHHLLLVQLVLEKPVRRLVAPRDRANRPIGLEQPVELLDDGLCIGPRCQRDHRVVERALHVEGGLGRAAVDPQDRIEAIVRNRQSRTHRIDIFRRERDAGDPERLQPAVEQHADLVARLDAIGIRKGLVDRGAARVARRGRRAAAQMQPRQRLVTGAAERDEARRHRLRRGGRVDDDLAHDPRLSRQNAGDGVEAGDQRQRRALQGDEDLRKPRLCIELLAASAQRLIGGDRADEHGDTRRNQQGDGDHLPAHGADIAPELAVEQAHHVTSSAESRRGLRVSPTMRPPPSRSTRSAMPAIAALWVMMMVVVPSRSLARAIAANTTLPVS